MKPFRALVPVLRREKKLALVREAIWRTWKPYRAKRLLALAQSEVCPVQFRNIDYFPPTTPSVSARARSAIVGIADLVCQGDFPFLGYGTVHLGLQPSWNRDFVSGLDWPEISASELRVIRHDGSDVKVPWELSRLQVLPVVAKAYRLTGEGRYLACIKELVSDWMVKNPVGVGVNWTIAMESALRGVSLCLVLSLLSPIQKIEKDWFRDVTHSVWKHLLFTEANLEFSHILRSNHYLSNVVGLFVMSAFLEGPGMERRRQAYKLKVEGEMPLQVYPDGGDFEASTGYHVFVLQMFTCAFLTMRAAGLKPSSALGAGLERMYRYIEALTDSRQTVPHVGDCDDGRIELMLDDLEQMLHTSVDQRNSLRISSVLGVGDALFGGLGGRWDDALWYGFPEPAPQPLASKVKKPSVVFQDSGISVARKGPIEVLLCAVPNGGRGYGSHTHNDKLALIARVFGEEFLCDMGTCFYTRDAELRNQYRSTKAHNTVIVDGIEQNSINEGPGFLFCLGNEARVSPISLQENVEGIIMRAEHSGYSRIGIRHRRTVRLVENCLTIEDDLDGTGVHAFELNYHLPRPWAIERSGSQGGRVDCEICGPSRISFAVLGPAELQFSAVPVRISRIYGGAAESGTRISVQGQAPFPCSLQTTFNLV
jgi:hypothetical protein